MNDDGGVAQLVRACGSYPQCPGFKSLHRHHLPTMNTCIVPTAFFHHDRQSSSRRSLAMRFLRQPFCSIIVPVLLLIFVHGTLQASAQTAEKERKTALRSMSSKQIVVNDETIQPTLEKARQHLQKKEYDHAMRILVVIDSYSEDVLSLLKFFKGHYEKVLTTPSTSQKNREEIMIKVKTISKMIPKYEKIREASIFGLGEAYAKRGNTEKAKKYLQKALETGQFSTDQNSPYMKAKSLLLELYQLEGTF